MVDDGEERLPVEMIQVPSVLEAVSTASEGVELFGFDIAPVLRVTDAQGDPITMLGSISSPWQITAQLVNGSGTDDRAMLTGTQMMDFVSGYANFTVMAITHSGTGYMIEFEVTRPSNASFLRLLMGPVTINSRVLSARTIDLPRSVSIGQSLDITLELIDTETDARASDIHWKGHTWTCTIEKYDKTGYLGLYSVTENTVGINETSLVTFNDLTLSEYGDLAFTFECVTSPDSEYSFMVYSDVISVTTESLPIVEIIQEISFVFKENFREVVQDEEAIFSARMKNFLINKYLSEDLFMDDFTITSEGSIVVTFLISGQTSAVESTMESLWGDLDNGLVFTYDNRSIQAEPYIEVDGEEWLPSDEEMIQVPSILEAVSASSEGIEGVGFDITPVLRVTDAQGDPISMLGSISSPWQITAQLVSGSGTDERALLIGTTMINVVFGYANFTDLAITYSGTGYMIEFEVTRPSNASLLRLLMGPFTINSRVLSARTIDVPRSVSIGQNFNITLELIDIGTKARASNIHWKGHTWTCTIEKYDKTGYLGVYSVTENTVSINENSVVTFSDLTLNKYGDVAFTFECVTSPVSEYSFMVYSDLISVTTESFPIVEIIRETRFVFKENFRDIVQDEEDIFNAAMKNFFITKYLSEDLFMDNFTTSEGSIVVTFFIGGQTSAVESTLESLWVDLENGLVFTYDSRSIQADPYVEVDGEEWLPADNEINQVPSILEAVSAASEGIEGVGFDITPVLRVTDAQGDPITMLGSISSPWQITAQLVSGSGTDERAMLIGTQMIDFVSEFANFKDLAITHSGTGYMIEFEVTRPSNVSFLRLLMGPVTINSRVLSARTMDLPRSISIGQSLDITLELIDTETEARASNIHWKGHTWTCTVEKYDKTGYLGIYSVRENTVSINENSVVTFSDLTLNKYGDLAFTFECVTSPVSEYSFMVYSDLISVTTESLPIVEVIREIRFVFKENFREIVQDEEDIFSAVMKNFLINKYLSEDLFMDNFTTSEGSIVVSFFIGGQTSAVEGAIESLRIDLENGLVFTYDNHSIQAEPFMEVDGEERWPADEEELDDSGGLHPAVIGVLGVVAVGLVLALFVVLLLKGTKSGRSLLGRLKSDGRSEMSGSREIIVKNQVPSRRILYSEKSFSRISPHSSSTRRSPGYSYPLQLDSGSCMSSPTTGGNTPNSARPLLLDRRPSLRVYSPRILRSESSRESHHQHQHHMMGRQVVMTRQGSLVSGYSGSGRSTPLPESR